MSKYNTLPAIEFLKECFRVCEKTGALIWLERPVTHFNNNRIASLWNGRYSGTPAGTITMHGYCEVGLLGRYFRVHRLIFKIVNGTDPGSLQIDHINRNRLDNRPENLRLATNKQNQVNLGKPHKNNPHGGRGIMQEKHTGKWVAWVTNNGRIRTLGKFPDRQQAQDVADDARRKEYGEFFA